MNENVINVFEKESIIRAMENLLDEYDYDYTKEALSKIVDTWAKNKADLITAFKSHPNYNGNFEIRFPVTTSYEVNDTGVKNFTHWIIECETDYTNYYWSREKNIRCSIDCLLTYRKRTIDDEVVTFLNANVPEVHAHAGQKTTRVTGKVMRLAGFDQFEDYNREFAKYCDAMSPYEFTRDTIISVHPCDYLTMSFGNSWASCHTIDKTNKRDMPNSYEGMYSSGTISYMLDEVSFLYYTIEDGYDGNECYLRDKVNRQMFHYELGKLIQGRLYPQGNDGRGDLYKPIRETVQRVVSELFNIPNYWENRKGTSACCEYIISHGTNYEDYSHFGDCNISFNKENYYNRHMIIGHNPICIECGCEHDVKNNINHCKEGWICEHCGSRIDDEDEVYWINGEPYCRDCVVYCECCEEYCLEDDATYIPSEDRYVCNDCLGNYYSYCEDCNEYMSDEYVVEIHTNLGWTNVCRDCLDEHYTMCEDCCEEYFDDEHASDFYREEYDAYLCDDCYKARKMEDAERNANEEDEEEAI